MSNRTPSTELSETKRKLLDSGISLMRAKGYNATTVDDICQAAGVTKGGFFHYFKNKDELAKAALTRFHEGKVHDYENAPFRKLADPMDRVFGRLDFVKSASCDASHQTKGCLIGVFAQEMAFTNPELRAACQAFFTKISDDFANDLAAAKAVHAPLARFEPRQLALLYLSIVQGSLMLAKVAASTDIIENNIEQLRSYLQTLFDLEPQAARAADLLTA